MTKVVFISYSHDSDEHRERVLALSERLRTDGVETRLDRYVGGTPKEGWPRWMLNQLDAADSVLVVCTETYYRRFRGREEPGRGKGVDWEGAIITNELYQARSSTVKFVPVLFTADDERHIPEPLRGHTHYTPTSEPGYQALYDFLLDQAGVEPGAVGQPKLKPRRKGVAVAFDEPPAPQASHIAPSKLPRAAHKLIGREVELARLNAAWNDAKTHVVTIVAWAGVGKTSLVAHWQASLAARDYDGARYFDWSFYSQGTRDQGGASSDQFIAKALEFFGDSALAQSPVSPWDKGERLAQLIAQQRTLLVLDGLEPLQHPPGPLAGELRDPAIATLLKGLAQRNPGLCVVTTRESVTDLAPFHNSTAPEWQLHHLSIDAGVELLQTVGVKGTKKELEQLARDVDGHALTLNLVGRYVARAHGGDVRRRDQVRFEKADANAQGGHAFKAMGAYERWLAQGGERGARQLALLHLIGLFDRPADAGCLAALRQAPAIPGLTEPLVELDDADWSLTISALGECGLVLVPSAASATGASSAALDAHPLVREYFAKQLYESNREGWRAAHSRLYEHLAASAEYRPDTIKGLQPLYQAVVHGCLAGRHREVLSKVLKDRVQRNDEFYSTKQLGGYGDDLQALALYFKEPWREMSTAVQRTDQSWVLHQAGYYLIALGRFMEANEPLRQSVRINVKRRAWREAAIAAGTLSRLQGALGNITDAVASAKRSVQYAERSNDTTQQIRKRMKLGGILHQAGRLTEASTWFREAEDLARRSGHYQTLGGFRHSELVLQGAERAGWRVSMLPRTRTELLDEQSVAQLTEACQLVTRRTAQDLADARQNHRSLLTIALRQLTLGRARLYLVLLTAGRRALARRRLSIRAGEREELRQYMNGAISALHRAGTFYHPPRGLLSRAWFLFLTGDPEGSSADLDEAWEIAERGPMRLHMADIHLYRARLFHAVKPYPWESPQADLAAARKLIEQCGYWRRKEELEDAEAAAQNW